MGGHFGTWKSFEWGLGGKCRFAQGGPKKTLHAKKCWRHAKKKKKCGYKGRWSHFLEDTFVPRERGRKEAGVDSKIPPWRFTQERVIVPKKKGIKEIGKSHGSFH